MKISARRKLGFWLGVAAHGAGACMLAACGGGGGSGAPSSGATGDAAGDASEIVVDSGPAEAGQGGVTSDDGATPGSPDAQVDAGPSPITAVAVGTSSSCALRGDGHVECWGQSANGFLGIGDAGLGLQVPPTKVPGLVDATQLATSDGETTCALRSSGNVVCWGMGYGGSLGDPGDGGSEIALAPVEVANLGDAIQISVGGRGSCAARQNGGVTCWGPFATTGDGGTSLSPVAIAGLATATQVAVGAVHACALLTGGAVACWGLNGEGETGQIFDGNSDSVVPTPTVVAGLPGVVQIGASYDHTCARTAGGEVFCWGGDYASDLGSPDAGAYSAVPLRVAGLSSAVDLAVGSLFDCARTAGGQVLCWGDNAYGELGVDPGKTPSSSTPLAIPGLTNVTAIAAGEYTACAVVDQDAVWCWGNNESGALGVGSSPAVPVQPVGLSNVYSIATGRLFSCAVEIGATWCWGSNESAALGAGIADTSYSLTNAHTTPVQVAGLTGASAVTAGDDFACALVNGGVKCWGDNAQGQLGLGTMSTTPVAAPVAVPGLSGIVEIAANGDDACARTSSGAVECWGYPYSFTATPTLVPELSAVQIAAGQDFACALRASPGGVACWGQNDSGQLGNGSTNSTGNTPVNVLNITDAIQIGVGATHACAVRAGGEVLCWGGNSYGQLGIGQTDEVSHPVPESVVGLSNAVEVHLGLGSCARRSDGSVVCWGQELLAGNQAAFAGPYLTTPGASVAGLIAQTISTEDVHACAIDGLRNVWCWGDDAYGQLGDGNVLYSFQPRQILGF
jgi:alpha-tubulin suppressor-like RCC1 family protein